MAEIYKVFMAKATQRWYSLSQAEREAMLEKVSGLLEQVGGKGLIYANSYWATEQYQIFGVEVFPDIEAAQKHAQLLNEIDWASYLESTTTLGTKWETG